MRRSLTLCLALMPLALCATAHAQYGWESQNVGWRTYMSGTVCGISTAGTTVIASDAAFLQYWKRLAGNSAPPRDVDFSKEQLVAINLGNRPSGGYLVFVDSVIKPRPQDIVVTYVEKRPSARDRVTTEVSAPYVIIRMGRQSGTITYKPMTMDGSSDRGRSNPPSDEGVGNVEWRNYMSGTLCNLTTPATQVINSQAAFLTYWKQFMGTTAIPKDIDFATEQLVAINLGSRPTGGYSVFVTAVEKPRPQDIVITYVERRPSKRDVVEQVKSSPYVIIKMRRQGGRVTFKPMTVDGR